LAHQRLAQSRTSLDDNEYISRFDRLDGAIKNVAFEIRQSWKRIPNWLSSVVNVGAEVKGGREMTIVGRACISRWVVDEILEQFFHPAIDPNLSAFLKEIEHNIRRNAPPPQSIEEDDAQSTKVCNWRLTTLDALQHATSGPSSLEARTGLSELLVNKLVASLQVHLHEPQPPGLVGGVQMIVDIAVGLSANLPLESRDVRVWYPLPGERFDSKFMKSETGIPPLERPIQSNQPSNQQDEKSTIDNAQGSDNASDDGPSKDDIKSISSSHAGIAGLPPQGGKDSKKSMGLGGRVKKALQGSTGPSPTPQSPGLPPGERNGKAGSSQASLPQGEAVNTPPVKEVEKVRVAGFMAVEVRGRSILVKAPVWL